MKATKVTKRAPGIFLSGKDRDAQHPLAKANSKKKSREEQLQEPRKRIHVDDEPIMISTWITNLKFVTPEEHRHLVGEAQKMNKQRSN